MTAQDKNVAWLLPRPKPDRYKGGMPLYAEKWLLNLAREIVGKPNPKILNVFCGMNTEGCRVDIKPEVEPDICCDAHELSKHLNGERFDIIFADPPYSNKEATELYGTPPLKYKRWTGECDHVLNLSQAADAESRTGKVSGRQASFHWQPNAPRSKSCSVLPEVRRHAKG